MVHLVVDADVLVFDLLDLYFCAARKATGVKLESKLLWENFDRFPFAEAFEKSAGDHLTVDSRETFKESVCQMLLTVKPVVGVFEFFTNILAAGHEISLFSRNPTHVSQICHGFLSNDVHHLPANFFGSAGHLPELCPVRKVAVVADLASVEAKEFVFIPGTAHARELASSLSNGVQVLDASKEDNVRWGLVNVPAEQWASVGIEARLTEDLQAALWKVQPMDSAVCSDYLKQLWLSSTEPINPVILKGTVVPGFARGSADLGIPTANVRQAAQERKKMPMPGVYFAWAVLAGPASAAGHEGSAECVVCNTEGACEGSVVVGGVRAFPAILSVGFNPYYDIAEYTVEPFLFGKFPGKFLGHPIALALVAYVRPEASFASFGQLVIDIQNDCELVTTLLHGGQHPLTRHAFESLEQTADVLARFADE